MYSIRKMIIKGYPPENIICLKCNSDMIEEELAPKHAYVCRNCGEEQEIKFRKKTFFERLTGGNLK